MPAAKKYNKCLSCGGPCTQKAERCWRCNKELSYNSIPTVLEVRPQDLCPSGKPHHYRIEKYEDGDPYSQPGECKCGDIRDFRPYDGKQRKEG